jgi:orotate phosphoribosyltransferase
MLSWREKKPVPGFFVRKAVKDHGTKKLIEAVADLKGKKIVILEDVTTTGMSSMIAVDAVKEAGAEVLLVLSVVDRQEGASDFFREKSIKFECLFTTADFIGQSAP